MAESHLNCSGFGLSAFDEETGKSKWDLVSTIDILSFEVFSWKKNQLVAKLVNEDHR